MQRSLIDCLGRLMYPYWGYNIAHVGIISCLESKSHYQLTSVFVQPYMNTLPVTQ